MKWPFVSKKSFALIFVLVLALVGVSAWIVLARVQGERVMALGAEGRGARMAGFPRLILWAWERPERLDFIDPRAVGVAFLSKTIYLREDKVIERPRMQPLKVPQGTTLVAVVRIETVRDAPPLLSTTQRAEVVKALAEASRAPNVSVLQIDFDALTSEREFYAKLLEDVRQQLPKAMPLSITALASWCMDDNWLDKLPVDEAVPMLFRMGVDEKRIRGFINEGGQFRSPLCRLSKGVSTDEPVKLASTELRTYVFHTQAWTERSVQSVIQKEPK
ncbi:MAG: DUF3142 domain-containing protein [Pyrinomonadaceae bacterium]|nr:DUF3142 domain-containing protein [Pyrinomonadaceae bacterium]